MVYFNKCSKCFISSFFLQSSITGQTMSKQRGVSAEEKRTRMLQIFYEKKEFFQLKVRMSEKWMSITV